jgi:hypothetical protein
MGSSVGLRFANHRRESRFRFRDIAFVALQLKDQLETRASPDRYGQRRDSRLDQPGENLILEITRDRAGESTRFAVHFESNHSDGGIRPSQ